METKEMIEKLSSLMKLDVDAIRTYEKVLEKIQDSDVSQKLMKFRDDHIKHTDTLADIIKKLGGTPPSRNFDLKGLFLTGAVMLERILGSEDALRTLKTGEEIISNAYDSSVTKEFPADIRSVLDIHNRDESEHLKYISYAIDIKIWGKAA